MKDDERNDSQESDPAEAIRRSRKFSLEEALARRAAGALAGASPVSSADQALLEIQTVLKARLRDGEGSLTRTILAQLEGNVPLLARHYERPAGALREYLAGILARPAALDDLVSQVDARWGREYGEKPRFERGESPPHPEDPYTRAGVRQVLTDLLADLDGR